MAKPKHIQITLPKPCNEDWSKMAPTEKGKFCAHCQKEVIDFTQWNDEALYRFFSSKTERVCGRFYASQLNRTLKIPPQPHSRLYQMFIGLGMTLIFTQPYNSYAKAPYFITENVIQTGDSTKDGDAEISIRGKAISYEGEVVKEVIIYLYQGTEIKALTLSDRKGDFTFRNISAGSYMLKSDNMTFDFPVVIRQGKTSTVTLKMFAEPLPYEPGGNRVVTGEEVPETIKIVKPRTPKLK